MKERINNLLIDLFTKQGEYDERMGGYESVLDLSILWIAPLALFVITGVAFCVTFFGAMFFALLF